MRIELYEILDPTALAEAQQIAGDWPKPIVESWPVGTRIVEQKNSVFDRPDWVDPLAKQQGTEYETHYHLVTLPSGGQLITLTQRQDWEKPWAFAKAPHVAWSIYVELETSEVSAWPRVCNMSIRRSIAPSDFAKHDWIISEIGLVEFYRLGTLSRKLVERTHIEHDGWGY